MTITTAHVLLLRDERGSVTAEFAVVLPAILAVLALVLGGIMLAGRRIELVSASAELARLEARGDTELAAEREQRLPEGVRIVRERSGQLLCVRLQAAPGSGVLAAIGISARSCAIAHVSASGRETASIDVLRTISAGGPGSAASSGPARSRDHR